MKLLIADSQAHNYNEYSLSLCHLILRILQMYFKSFN